MTAAALAQAEDILAVPIDSIRHSSIANYRRRVDQAKLKELADSIRQHGVLQPLVLRRMMVDTGAVLELVFGERRWAAAELADLETVPCVIRDYSDEEVREARIVENLLRENPDALDEAAGLQELLKANYSEQQLADKLGQPLRYVRERLALNGLCEEGRKALTEGKVLLAVALIVAALPAAMQVAAMEEVLPDYRDDLMTAANARHAISRRVLLALKEAPFKLDDATLVPAAGACTDCPRHTGSQGNLFGQAEDGDHCLDAVCHKGKVDALYQLRVKRAKEEGQEVLGKKASAEALSQASSYSSGPLVKLDDEVSPPHGKRQQIRKLLGKELPPITIARDEETGAPVELVPRAALQKALKLSTPEKTNHSAPDAKAKGEREAELVQGEVRRRTMLALVDACDEQCRKGAIPRPLLNLLIRGALVSTWSEIAKRVADRRGLPLTDEASGTPKKGARRQLAKLTAIERIERLLPALDEGALAALLLELVMGRAAPGKWSEGTDCYTDACTELGVNPKGIEVTVKAEGKAGKRTDAKEAPKLAKPKLADRPTGWAEGSVKPKAVKPAATPQKKAAKKRTTPKLENPAKGQVVHYVDPTGLSETGVACGSGLGKGKGIVTDEHEKVTCKSCRRTAGLDAAPAEGSAAVE